ncbi:MAG: SagB/ThcOx family dehydrogenase [Deltaproteobacteria bacterium]|nr:SagB/ThcOx family dehydrogenase [Deltaproteobacteria bacterium]
MLPRLKSEMMRPAVAPTGDVKLPAPTYDGATSIEKSLRLRRSVREYSNNPLVLGEISQLLWAAQGITDPAGLRTAPSAGALYPLEIYLLAGNITDLRGGVYRYRAATHDLVKMGDVDRRSALCRAALDQPSIREAPAVLVLCAVYERTTSKYGNRGIRYVHMEAGHAAQNVCLQAVALNLGAAVLGAFEDEKIKLAIPMRGKEEPLYIVAVGRE